MHKITTHNREIMMNKVDAPTDPAIMVTVDPLLESLSVELPNKIHHGYCCKIIATTYLQQHS